MRDASLNPSFSVSRLAVHLTLWGACALYLVPLLVMLLTSFKTPDDIRTGNLLSLPDTFTVIGWLKAWDSVGAFFWNSVLITVPGVLISTFIGALNGYVLSMWRFRGSQLFFGALLFGCFLPFQGGQRLLRPEDRTQPQGQAAPGPQRGAAEQRRATDP